MPRLNPEEPLRATLKSAFDTVFSFPTYAKKVPKSNVITGQYILLANQVATPTAKTKNCWEWLCSIDINCYYVGMAGYASPVQNDNVKQTVVQIIEGGIDIPGWYVKEANFIQSLDLDVESETQSIERKVIKYDFWLGQLTD